VESDSDRKETEVVILEDSERLVEGSSGDKSGSRSSGSSYSFGHSRTSRKRMAEESPERKSLRVGDTHSLAQCVAVPGVVAYIYQHEIR